MRLLDGATPTSYAPNGDVLGVNDSVNGNWVYQYDDFNRLLCSNLSSNGTCAAPTSGTATYTYIQVNLPGGALVATYMYDANGNRVSKTSGSVSLGYLFDTEGHVVSETNLASPATWNRGEIFAAGRHIATYANGTTYFIETDWLGTERVRTNVSGTSCETITSLPFGDGQTTSGSCGDPTPLHFTGKERDSESGLDNFRARYNSSSMGRWVSPDAINLTDERVQNPANTLNKYIYGGNNPLKYIDPDGRDITVFYTNTGTAGHFWMVAYDQATGNSAVMNFGPRDQTGAARTQEAAGIAVPGDTDFSSHITSADELKQDFTSLTIQTNPEDTQKAIQAINTYNGVPHEYMTYQQNCTTVCRDVLNKILKLNSTSIIPKSLWGDIYQKWSDAALNQKPGSKPPDILSKHGVDYGRSRYGMNTFDFMWLLLRSQKACVTTLAPDGKRGVKPVTTCS